MKEELILNEIKKIRWQHIIDRNESILCRSIIDGGYKYFKKATGMDWHENTVFVNGMDLMHDVESIDALKTLFLRGGLPLFNNFLKRLVHHVRSFDRLARRIEKTGCQKLKQKELLSLLKGYTKSALYANNFLLPMPIADGVISKMILDLLPHGSEQEKHEWLAVLTFPAKENSHTKEERSFYNLAKAYAADKKDIGRLISRHLKRYAWIGARSYWWDSAWKKEDIEGRLKEFAGQTKDPDQEIDYLNSIRKERAKATRCLIKQLKIKRSSELYGLIRIAKEYAYTRTWRTDIIYRSGYRARGMFQEIAKRAGLGESDPIYMAIEEILFMEHNRKAPLTADELSRRKEFSGTFLLNDKYYILSGNGWKNKLKQFNAEKEEMADEIKGSIAFQGKVQGIVKIVLSVDDIKKVERGGHIGCPYDISQLYPGNGKGICVCYR